MDTLKRTSILIFFILLSCKRPEYIHEDKSFYDIYLRKWNSSICPKKIVFEKYLKNTNFKKIIQSDSDFEIRGCDISEFEFNQRIFMPNSIYKGKIDYDIKIIVDDSIEYKVTDISNKIDTIHAGGHKFVIMNNIKSLVINGKKMENKNAPLNLEIQTNLGKIIKKK